LKIKALSIKQPWAWAILHAGKDYENRTWYVPHTGLLAIHAGKKIDKEGLLWLHKQGIMPPANLPTGCIVGVVNATECIDTELFGKPDSKWAFGPFCLKMEIPVAFDVPILCKGQLGLFEVEVPYTFKQTREAELVKGGFLEEE
jgi:hypothetical protein